MSELIPGGFWDWNIKTSECYISPRWGKPLGYSEDDLPHHISTWEKLIHPDDMPRVQEALKIHWEERTPLYRSEHRLKMKDGSYHWTLDQGRVLTWDADGRPIRMVGVDIDIHDRKMAELAGKEQAAKLT